MRRAIAVAAVVAMAALVAGCGKLEVIASGAEKDVSELVISKTGIHPTNVTCPSGVSAKAGVTFDCHFIADGAKYTARMLITKVKGTAVYFDIRTVRG